MIHVPARTTGTQVDVSVRLHMVAMTDGRILVPGVHAFLGGSLVLAKRRCLLNGLRSDFNTVLKLVFLSSLGLFVGCQRI